MHYISLYTNILNIVCALDNPKQLIIASIVFVIVIVAKLLYNRYAQRM